MKKRLIVLCAMLLLLAGFCGWRVQTLQQKPSLREAAVEQATVTVTLGKGRGTIYDCHLTPLVNKESTYGTAFAPTDAAKKRIRATFDHPTAESLLARLSENKPFAITLSEPPAMCDGITIRAVPVRYTGTVEAPHILGYVNENGGVCGIEAAYDEWLSSYSGELTVTYAVDAYGMPIGGTEPSVNSTLSRCKGGVVLTIDKRVQAIAEQAATKMTRGAVVILEPKTGEIRAVASVPSYQPQQADTAMQAEHSPLLNRAFADYNCGSVFKIVTAAAALEAGLSPKTAFSCEGGVECDGNFFHCHYILGHGRVDMKEAFAKSCNPYFIQLALEVGADAVYDMAVSFGLDRAWTPATGLSTARAVLPSLKNLRASKAALCNLAFGQGELLATPVHVAQLAAAIANGGSICRPTLIAGTVDENGEFTKAEPSPPQEVFSKKTAAVLADMMTYTMEEGTGAKGQPYYAPAAAKTGTAETGWFEGDDEVIQHWFTGYFPAENPRYVITVLCENSEASGESASPVFAEICDELYLEGLKNTVDKQ